MQHDIDLHRDPDPHRSVPRARVRFEACPSQPVRWHDCANVFPMLQGEPFVALVEDIGQNGVREPIVMLDGAILDGRNRYMAARQLGIEYPVIEYDGDDPLAYVLSMNLARRHLSESQRAMVASKLANLKKGDNQHTVDGQICPTSTATAANLLNVSERSVKTARKVRDEGDDSLIDAVEADTVSVSAAATVATLPREEQAEIVARGETEILAAAKAIRAKRAEERRTERLERFVEVSQSNTDLPAERRYPILLADPPWQYDDPVRGANDRSPENHYPTMALEVICALPVAERVAADDALLFLWATSALLPQALRVIEAWGFEYRSNACWDKEVFGLGSYVRNQHELLLIARRGNVPAPAPETRPPSIYRERRGAHSAKPAYFHELIETQYPSLPKIELFARAPRDGWAVWGNQSEAVA